MHCYTSGRGAGGARRRRWAPGSRSPGIATFKAAEDVRAVIRDMPADRIIVETDCPYLAPVPHRGRRNEPAYLPHVLAKLAEIRGWTPGRGGGAHRGRLLRPVRPDPAPMSGDAGGHHPGLRLLRRRAARRRRLGRLRSGRTRRTGARRCSLLVRRRRARAPERETTVMVDTSPDLRLQTARRRRQAAGRGAADPRPRRPGARHRRHARLLPCASAARIACHMDAATDATDDAPLRLHLRGRGRLSGDLRRRADPAARRALGGGRAVGRHPGRRPSTRTTAASARSAIASAAWPIPATWWTSTRRRSRRWRASTSGSSTPCATRPHPTHAHLERTLAWIDAGEAAAGDPDQPAHRPGLRDADGASCRPGVEPAYRRPAVRT